MRKLFHFLYRCERQRLSCQFIASRLFTHVYVKSKLNMMIMRSSNQFLVVVVCELDFVRRGIFHRSSVSSGQQQLRSPTSRQERNQAVRQSSNKTSSLPVTIKKAMRKSSNKTSSLPVIIKKKAMRQSSNKTSSLPVPKKKEKLPIVVL